MEYGIGIGIGLLIGLVIGFLVASSLATKPFGNAAGLALGKNVALRAAGDAEFAKKLEHLFNPPPVKPSGEPVRLLALLQRDARLLDFLMENLGAYSDEQIGASARNIQVQSQAVLKKHLTLEPVMSQEEGSTVTIPSGFDPSAITLVGNVTGQPPFKGRLEHGGWRVKTMNIPKAPDGHDEFVLYPAEVAL